MDAQPPKQDRVVARTFLETLRRDVPGYATDNRLNQSNHFRGVSYVAIRAIYDWLGSATVNVTERRKASKPGVRKAMRSPQQGSRDDEYAPADPSHPLADLFEWINGQDTFPQFVAQWVLQSELTGNVLLWCPFNRAGRPAEMWVLPTALCYALPPSHQYPDGAWRVNLSLAGGYMPVMATGLPTQAILSGREVLHYRHPHPLSRWDGLSPLTAMAREIDQYDAMQESRISAFNNGFTPDVMVALEGATDEEIQRVGADFKNRTAGARNHRKAFITNAPKAAVTPMNTTPREMDFTGSWEQAVKASLAGFGVMSSVVGLVEATSYAAFYAARQQMLDVKIKPTARNIGAFLTKHLARPFYGARFRVEVDPGSVNDHELQEKQISSDATNNAITVNEIRGLRNREPVEGGDVPPQLYAARQQQATQPQPGQPGGDPPADPSAPQPGAHPLDALGDAVLGALEVRTDSLGRRYGMQGGHRVAVKALPWEEDKHARDRGRFAPKGQGGGGAGPGADASPPASPAGSPGTDAGPVPPEVAGHPKVRAAVDRLAGTLGGVASKVTAALSAVGMTPEDLVGNFDDWSRIFVTHHSDVVAHALGVDAMTAAHVLSHLAAEGWARLKGMIGGKAAGVQSAKPQPAAQPGARQDGSDGGPPRPSNSAGEGSLPNRVGKAVSALDLRAALEEFAGTLG